MPPLTPSRWLINSPVAILPMLAAVLIQGRPPGSAGWTFRAEELVLLVQHHWAWLGVALGLGVWVGWHCAAPASSQTAGLGADAS